MIRKALAPSTLGTCPPPKEYTSITIARDFKLEPVHKLKRGHKSSWNQWLLFCELLQLDPYQICQHKLCYFINFRAKEQKGYKRAERNKVVPRDWNTIRKDMWGIKKMILYETGFDAPYHDWPLVRENLKAVRRQQGGKPDHRKPLTSYLMKAVPPIYYWRH